MNDVVSAQVAQPRFYSLLLGSFSFLALVLAAMGIYGVIAYAVTQRTQEIGVRMALGAQRGNVLLLILGTGLKLAAGGLAIGLLAALLLTRFMAGMLYGVAAINLFTFAMATLVLVAVVLAAMYIPARRATKVDPLVALRYE